MYILYTVQAILAWNVWAPELPFKTTMIEEPENYSSKSNTGERDLFWGMLIVYFSLPEHS